MTVGCEDSLLIMIILSQDTNLPREQSVSNAKAGL